VLAFEISSKLTLTIWCFRRTLGSLKILHQYNVSSDAGRVTCNNRKMPEDDSKESKHVARIIICYIEVNTCIILLC